MPKGVSNIGGLRDIKTMSGTGKRSIPRVAGSAYLDLYMLQRKKEWLEKKDTTLEKWRVAIQKKLEATKKEMETLKKLARQEKGCDSREVVKEESREKRWKKMMVSY